MGHNDDSEFLKRLSESTTGVMRVASYLAKRSYNVRITPMPIWPTKAERQANWQDGGDIEIVKRVEVKHRGISFTCSDDYPFETVFIDEVYKVDKALSQIEFWVVLNDLMTHVAIIRPSTRRHWVVEEKRDPFRDRICQWYSCPVHLVSFRSFHE